ncbi:MAG: peptide chain release factor N(5)-glutamine methyltransferase [Candidatus Thiodiazotropha sp. (ex Lucinoma borealis)]|nr:peptide chain release factor N(5)-glutamine methyltransferase [Candidatus Thiodiazotropha sp. (ex Lucinoma borealis)]
MITLQQTLQSARSKLADLPHANPELEAALLLCHLLDKPRSYLFAWPEKTLTPDQYKRYIALIEQRLSGTPIAYITGVREFWSMTLQVSPDTLIPRPETELLVERSLYHLQGRSQPRLADLGTGSGAIALALASERPDAQIHATDLSAKALTLARENAASHSLNQVIFFHGSWCNALPTGVSYDLIVSNPPYIEEDDLHLTQGDLPREPSTALVSGSDGLSDIRLIIQQATAGRLKGGGWLLLEHGYQQATEVHELLRKAGLAEIATHQDLAGQPRITESRMVEK